MLMTEYDIKSQIHETFVIIFPIQGCEKISITFTKYVNRNQQGTDNIQPIILEKIPIAEAKNPKIISQ